ncbi:MAG: pilus assembly protein N-terminal domain-containing protein [Pirellulaceae bacterium]|nr:pilus assembly protein N-terminal domain-containing protein [Pirellulaceae bacterium]
MNESPSARLKNARCKRKRQIYAVLLFAASLVEINNGALRAENWAMPTIGSKTVCAKSASFVKLIGLNAIEQATSSTPQVSLDAPQVSAVATLVVEHGKCSEGCAETPSVPAPIGTVTFNSPTFLSVPNSTGVEIPPTLAQIESEVLSTSESKKGSVKIEMNSVGSVSLPRVVIPEKNVEAQDAVLNALAAIQQSVNTPAVLVGEIKTSLVEESKIAKVDEPAKADDSRAPNVVRIPSMTLARKETEASQITTEPTALAAVSSREHTPTKTAEASADGSPLEVVSSDAVSSGAVTPAPVDAIADHSPIVDRESTRFSPKVVAIAVSTTSDASRYRNNVEVENHKVVEKVIEPESQTQNADLPSTGRASDEGPMAVHVTYRNTRNVNMDGSIEKIAIEDESICKAMVYESDGIMLLGIGCGTTRLRVWMTSEANRRNPPRLIDITVSEAWSAPTVKRATSIEEAIKSIAELYPTSRIAIKPTDNGSITVFGITRSEEQAKQIASLVRKLFLVPVQDRIAVHSN